MVKIQEDFLTPNKYSRPQTMLEKVLGIVWHWVANPNTSASGNRNFFENRKLGKTNYGSAQYIIGLEGEIVCTMPDGEMAYHVGSKTYTKRSLDKLGSYPNGTTIGIECTHVDWDGNMTKATRNALIQLTAYLLEKHKLTANDIWLHQEVVGWKDCHRYYVNNPSEYKKDKDAVAKLLKQPAVSQVSRPVKEDIVVVEADAFGMYEIRKGDTLWGLSVALDVPVKELEKLNPKIDASALKIGSKIKVKEVSVSSYTIAKGDTLWEIATKFNTTVAKLEELNKGVQAKALQVGAKIAVPESGAKTSAPAKKESKPAPKKHSHKFTKLGRAKGSVWSHTQSDFKESTRKEIVSSNTRLEVCCEEDGLYYTNKGWISKKYVSIVGSLNSYDLPSVNLRRGSRGSAVVQVQRALNKLYFKCGAEDGSYGAKTEDAVKRFQSMYCRPVDGMYGRLTERAMEKQLNK